MNWRIKKQDDGVDYRVGKEYFTTFELEIVTNDQRNETGPHKEPNDSVVENIYSADSEHGIFKWRVIARRSGSESSASIEYVEAILIPDHCEETETPQFEIEYDY